MRWYLVIYAAVGLLLGGLVYLTFAVSRFGLIRKAKKKWARALLSLGAVALCFGVSTLFMGLVNTFVVFIHAVVFFLLFGLGFRIAAAIRKKKFRINWQGWLALGATVIVLSVGFVLCHHVFRTEYALTTEKTLGLGLRENGTVRIALIADSHIGATFDGEGFAEHLATIKSERPDVLFIAGDFVDDSSRRADVERACEALAGVDAPLGVWYVYGNHDRGYGRSRDFDARDLERMLADSGVHVLEDEAVELGDLCVVGRKDASSRHRKELSELLEGVDPDKYIVVLDHQPTDYEKESETAADLVLSGHTHGGQLWPLEYVGEGFGINDRTYGYERRGGTDFIVTSGISCWEIDFKTGTKSEYVIIEVHGTTP